MPRSPGSSRTGSRPREIRVVAECKAETALARIILDMLREQLERQAGLARGIRATGLAHRPREGGHDRMVLTTLRALSGYARAQPSLVLLVIDYEEDSAARYWTEAICPKERGQRLWGRRGAELLLCTRRPAAQASPPGGRRAADNDSRGPVLVALVWKPRSEEFLEAVLGRKLTAEERKKVKKDERYTRRLLQNALKNDRKFRQALDTVVSSVLELLERS